MADDHHLTAREKAHLHQELLGIVKTFGDEIATLTEAYDNRCCHCFYRATVVETGKLLALYVAASLYEEENEDTFLDLMRRSIVQARAKLKADLAAGEPQVH